MFSAPSPLACGARAALAFTAIALVGIAVSLGLVLTVAALLDATFGAHPPDAQGSRALGLFSVRFDATASPLEFAGPATAFIELTTRDLPGVAARTVFTMQGKRATFQTGARRSVVQAHGCRLLAGDAVPLSRRAPVLRGGRPGRAQRVAVIGATWPRRLFGGRRASGRPSASVPETYRVIGVVDDVSFLRATPFAEVWVPLGTYLTPAIARPQAQDDLGALVVLDDDAKIGGRAARRSRSALRGCRWARSTTHARGGGLCTLLRDSAIGGPLRAAGRRMWA